MSANTETTGGPPKGYMECPKKCGRWTNIGDCWTCRGRADWNPRSRFPDWTSPIAAPAAHIERRKGQAWRCQTASGFSCDYTLLSFDGKTWTASHSEGRGAVLEAILWDDAHWTMTLLADATPEPAKSCETCGSTTHEQHGLGAKSPPTQEAPVAYLLKCGFRVTGESPAQASSARAGHEANCIDCNPMLQPTQYREPHAPAQEAPKAAPVCTNGRDCPSPKSPVLERALRDERQFMCDPCYLDLEKTLGKMMRGESTGKPYAGPERLPKPQLAADWVWDCLPEAGR